MTQQQKKAIRGFKNKREENTRLFNQDFNKWFDLQLRQAIRNAGFL